MIKKTSIDLLFPVFLLTRKISMIIYAQQKKNDRIVLKNVDLYRLKIKVPGYRCDPLCNL